MLIVVTNSRRFATDKLMAQHGLRPPFDDVHFIETFDELQAFFADVAKSFGPLPSYPALLIWQRGRMSKDAERLRDFTLTNFKIGLFAEPRSHQ